MSWYCFVVSAVIGLILGFINIFACLVIHRFFKG